MRKVKISPEQIELRLLINELRQIAVSLQDTSKALQLKLKNLEEREKNNGGN